MLSFSSTQLLAPLFGKSDEWLRLRMCRASRDFVSSYVIPHSPDSDLAESRPLNCYPTTLIAPMTKAYPQANRIAQWPVFTNGKARTGQRSHQPKSHSLSAYSNYQTMDPVSVIDVSWYASTKTIGCVVRASCDFILTPFLILHRDRNRTAPVCHYRRIVYRPSFSVRYWSRGYGMLRM